MSRLSELAALLVPKEPRSPRIFVNKHDAEKAAAALREAEQLLRDMDKWFGKFSRFPVLHDEGLPERIRALIG